MMIPSTIQPFETKETIRERLRTTDWNFNLISDKTYYFCFDSSDDDIVSKDKGIMLV